MEKMRLLIADRNKEFGKALGRAISGIHPDIRITVKPAEELFGCGGRLTLPKSAVSEWDLILGDEEDCARTESGHVIGLSDRSQASFETDGCLYRYAGVSALVSSLRIRFQELGGQPLSGETVGGRKTEWISFYSGAGGSGKTAAALGIARFLALEKNSRVLYLSLEEPDATSFYFGHTAVPSASQLLYHFEEWREKEDLSRRMLSFLHKDDCGVETIWGGGARNEFAQMEQREMEQFLSSLREMNRFEYIFLDLPGGFTDLALFALSQSDAVIFVESGRAESRYKTEQAEHVLNRLWEQGGPGRIRIRSDSTGQGAADGLSEGTFYLPYDPDSFVMEENRMRIRVHKEFGRGVAQIAEQLECGWETAG